MSSRGTRIAALIAAILVGLSYFFPLWGYSIYAPQYPEGLYMTIWSDHVGGDVRNVNILNHYVGMKAINDSQFPEFKIAPVALLTFSVLALFLAVVPWLPLFWIWISGFVVGGVVGMWDLARWGYDFGTQLSDYAPIKIPGMHFVPPLLGKKIMLNITSYSYPHVASYMLAGAFLPMLWVAACALPKRHAKVVAVVLVIFGLQGCLFRSSPEPIVYGSDTCSNCQMTISDNRFGGETLLKGGKVSKFDSLDCILEYVSSNKDRVSKIFFSDFFEPGKFISSEDALFVKSPEIRGPMGQEVLVSSRSRRSDLEKHGSHLVDWLEYQKRPHLEPVPPKTNK